MTTRRAVRIGNCSGFYGDRISAAREMVEGGDLDVLTGDYLAELTMLILWKARQKDPTAGFARTFLTQVEQVLGTCLDRNIKIVANAGGLNPAGLAAELSTMAERLGLAPKIAWIEGDDLSDRVPDLIAAGHGLINIDTGEPFSDAGHKAVTANAYLGGWGITEALSAGSDIVICPRVTDASLVSGPAAWWHGWDRTDYDQLAGAVAAGHVIECGPQATGGNYSFFAEVTDRRYPGYPIAEVRADGSTVITKHDDTGGLVSPGTVTAQLLYEIQSPTYANPDVLADFSSLRLEQEAPHRVLIAGAQGGAPPPDLKVAINYVGGYRNTMTLVLTGLDIEEKAEWARSQLFEILGGEDRFDEVDVRLQRFDHDDAPTNDQATAHLRVTVMDGDRSKVGRRFSNAVMELFLAGYPGFHTSSPPTDASSYGVYWPALVPVDEVEHRVHLPGGVTRVVPHGPTSVWPAQTPSGALAVTHAGPTVPLPLGRICASRSGDKGGNANVGLWTRDDEGYEWLRSWLTVDRFRQLLPEADGLEIRRWDLPNLRALNFIVVGLLGSGVAASPRPDPQAKGLGEYIRSRVVPVPAELAGRVER